MNPEAEKYADEKIKDYRTPCCEGEAYSRGRATAFCKKCGKDVMLEVILIYEMFLKEYKSA